MPDEVTPNPENDLADIDAALATKLAGESVIPDPNIADTEEAAAEAEAGRKGWVSRDKYKGDPAKWKPASQYLEDGRRFEKNTKRELEELRAKYAELEKHGKAFAQFHEESMARKDQELKDAIADAKRQARQALREGDDDLADQLEERVELLQEERKGLKKPEEPKPAPVNLDEDPVITEWVEDGNEWFRDNPKLRAYSIEVGKQLLANGETLRNRKFLDKVSAIMAEEFPRQFQKKTVTTPRADQVSSADASGSPTGYSIHDLPAEDLMLMKEFIAKGWTTKEKFLKNYFSGEKKVHRS